MAAHRTGRTASPGSFSTGRRQVILCKVQGMHHGTGPAPPSAQAAVVDVEEPLASALDTIDESFFLMGAVRDASGRIVDFEYRYCNGAALALLGCRRDDVLGRRL